MSIDKKNKLLLSSVAIAISGCSNMHTEGFTENKEIATDYIDDINIKKESGIVEIKSGVIVDDFFVDNQPYTVPEKKSDKLPSYLPSTIDYIQKKLQTEREFSAQMLKEFGIKVVFSRLITSEEEEQPETGEDINSAGEGAELSGTVDESYYPSEEEKGKAETPIPSADLELLYKGQIDNPDPDNYVNPIKFSGTLADFMDLVASDRELSWKFDEAEGHFVFYDLDTVVFELIDNTGEFKTESSVSTESETSSDEEGASSSSATSQNVEFKDNAKHWESLQETINSLLGAHGKASFDQKNGLVIVTDRRPVLDKVDRLVNQLNDKNGTMVFLDVEYVKVVLDKSSKIGVDIDAADFLSSIGSGSTTGGLTTAGDLAESFASIFSMNFTNAGVSAMIGSLQKQGNMTVRYEMPISTMNNTPHPFQTSVSQTYVHKVEVERDDEGVITSIIPDTKVNKTGITSIFTPRVIRDRVIVNGTLTLSENLEMDVKEEMGSIMLPTNSGETHQIKSIIPNGVTRVASIQTLRKTNGASEGALGESSWLLGGSEESKLSTEVAIVLVTPYIIK